LGSFLAMEWSLLSAAASWGLAGTRMERGE
jgi:hypothetical protein